MSRTFRLRKESKRWHRLGNQRVQKWHKVLDSRMGLWFYPRQVAAYNVMRSVVELPVCPVQVVPDGDRHDYFEKWWWDTGRPKNAAKSGSQRIQENLTRRIYVHDYLKNEHDKFSYEYAISKAHRLETVIGLCNDTYKDFTIIPIYQCGIVDRDLWRNRGKHDHVYCHMIGSNYESSFDAYEYEEKRARKTLNKRCKERPSRS